MCRPHRNGEKTQRSARMQPCVEEINSGPEMSTFSLLVSHFSNRCHWAGSTAWDIIYISSSRSEHTQRPRLQHVDIPEAFPAAQWPPESGRYQEIAPFQLFRRSGINWSHQSSSSLQQEWNHRDPTKTLSVMSKPSNVWESDLHLNMVSAQLSLYAIEVCFMERSLSKERSLLLLRFPPLFSVSIFDGDYEVPSTGDWSSK